MRVLAYLDPGSGSIVLQAILGGLAGIAIALKFFGRRILRLFGIKPKTETTETSETPETAGRS